MEPFHTRRPRYSHNVGVKFHQDGSPCPFAGNTVLCPIPIESSAFSFLVKFRDLVKRQRWANKYAFLPPSSYHMTVFEGVCDQVRTPVRWTSKLPIDAPLEKVDRLLMEQWANVTPPPSFAVRHRFFFALDTMGLRLSPMSSEEDREMREFRDTLAQILGMIHPNHNRYRFHITLAYNILRLSLADILKILGFSLVNHRTIKREFGVLRLGSPELTFFEDLTHFARSRKDAVQNRQNNAAQSHSHATNPLNTEWHQ